MEDHSIRLAEEQIEQLEQTLLSNVDSDDFRQWYRRLENAVDSTVLTDRRLKLRYALYLYLLYKDMFNIENEIGDRPIEEDMIMLLNSDKIIVNTDGIDRTVYLYDHQLVDDHIILIRDSIKEIEIPSASDIHSPYLKLLPQLHTIIITPTEELRKMSADEIELDDYTEEIPNGLENLSIKISRSTR